MKSARPCSLPPTAMLRSYQESGGYADCYCTEVSGTISQAAFIEAFYTTRLFKLERVILKWFAARPSTDMDAKLLAKGATRAFSAWRVEDQSVGELLLSDFTGRTRSWLMAMPIEATAAGAQTRLYFGSAIIPRVDAATGKQSMGPLFQTLLGFHRIYSRLLLNAARRRTRMDGDKAVGSCRSG